MTAETADGPWELVPAEIRGDEVVVTSSHLSLFQAFKSLVGAVGDVARDSVEGLTSGVTAEAEPPACEGEDAARGDGYGITSDDGDTVYWCLGQADDDRYLTVVNNRRYALLLSHSDNLTVSEQTDRGEALNELVAEALTLDHQVTLGHGESVTFRVDITEGTDATVATELDGVGSALYQLDAGIDTLQSILTRFGAKFPAEGLRTFLADTDCALSIRSQNPGTILGECFDFETIRNAWGAGAATILAPVILSGSLFSFFETQLNALGDQFNGRDRYAITISRGEDAGGTDGGDAIVLGASFESTSTLWDVRLAGDRQRGSVTDESGFGVELTDVATGPDGTVLGVGFGTLYRLDATTGGATTIGSLGQFSVNALEIGPDGRVLGADESGLLVEIDPATGAATPVGAYGGALGSSGDLAFGPDGTLYATASRVLVTVDPATGAATRLIDLPVPDVYGLAFVGGELYGLATSGGTSCPLGALMRIDLDAATVEQLRCLAFPPGGASSP
ncbi:MAG TPA: hypothetical protein VFH36_20080 [Acidimicrobiales bacterium]|nr:hypothetical protein [Acidimicrobiales bacterium]